MHARETRDRRRPILDAPLRERQGGRRHPLTRRLGTIRRAGTKVAEIKLAPLAREDLAQLIAGALRCEPQSAAPLAHLASVLIGEGEATVGGELMSGGDALAKVGLEPVVLEAKEGLALINGTQMMVAVGGVAVIEAEALARLADVIGAMSLEALKGSGRPFDERIERSRPHPGQAQSAANLRALLASSEIMVILRPFTPPWSLTIR